MFKEVVSTTNRLARTDGAFDITVSPLMKYWFERYWNTTKLDSTEVDSIMQFVGMDRMLKAKVVSSRTILMFSWMLTR